MERWLYAWGTGYAAIGTASILLPLYAIELGGGAFIVGAITAVAAFSAVPGAVLWGFVAGRFDRSRPFVTGSLLGSAVILGATPLVDDPRLLLLVNAALWFTVAAAAPVLCLLVVEGEPHSTWGAHVGTLNKVQGYGWVAGITFGTLWAVSLSDFYSIILIEEYLFRFFAGALVVAAVLLATCYPARPTTTPKEFVETFAEKEQTDWGSSRFVRAIPYGQTRLYWTITAYAAIKREGREPFRSFDDQLQRYLIATLLFFAGFAVFWAPLPAYIIDIGHSMQVVFGLILLTNFGAIVGYGPIGDFFERSDLNQVQAATLVVRAILITSVAAVVVLLPVWNLPLLAWLFTIIGVTWAMVGGTAPSIVTNLSTTEYKSEALGVYVVVAGLAAGIGSIAGGWISEVVSYTVAFLLASGMIVVGAILIPSD